MAMIGFMVTAPSFLFKEKITVNAADTFPPAALWQYAET